MLRAKDVCGKVDSVFQNLDEGKKADQHWSSMTDCFYRLCKAKASSLDRYHVPNSGGRVPQQYPSGVEQMYQAGSSGFGQNNEFCVWRWVPQQYPSGVDQLYQAGSKIGCAFP